METKILKHEYTKIYSGWEDFDKEFTLINIHTIGDNSCYYHSLLYALFDTYKNHIG